MFRVLVKTSAQKSLKKLDTRYQPKILRALHVLASDPYIGKSLLGELVGFYSLRVWPYRIIYQLMKSQRTVFVVAIDHRQSVYS